MFKPKKKKYLVQLECWTAPIDSDELSNLDVRPVCVCSSLKKAQAYCVERARQWEPLNVFHWEGGYVYSSSSVHGNKILGTTYHIEEIMSI